MSAVESRTEDIKQKVVKWIEGKHSRIGIILPGDPNPNALNEIHQTIAEILVNQAKRKAAQK